MTENSPTAPAEGLAPIIELLCAHAALVQNTSDHMGLAITEGMCDLRELVPALDAETQVKLHKALSRIMVALQSQDVLRQQVGVLMHGVKSLGEAVPPADQDAAAWISAQMEGLRAAYVMREQYVLHADVTGTQVPAAENDAEPVLF